MERRSRTVLIVLGSLLALAILHFTGLLSPFENLAKKILSPLGITANSMATGLNKRVGNGMTEQQCHERLEDMEARLSSLSVDYVKLRALEEENEVLRKTLGYLQKQGYDAVMARVISRSSAPGKAVIMVDRGVKDGLEIGMAVIVGDGVYVGKITTIQERTSSVTLISDQSSRVAISKSGEKKLLGLIEGKGNWATEGTLIPQQEALAPNDLLVTSGTEGKIPANLAIGLVNQVMARPTDPFKNASIEPLAPLEYLETVAILRPQALRPN